jgi:ubiquinone/menaquinone biosynthesis C-methylase UbiE
VPAVRIEVLSLGWLQGNAKGMELATPLPLNATISAMDDQERWQVDDDAAAAYQRFLVPAVTGPWAAVLVERVGLNRGERVLDVACGTGAVARLAAERVGATGHVTALDINARMLEVGQSLPPVAGATIEWREGSALAIPLPDAAFDVVTCQLGLQFFPDRPLALQEMRRVLSNGGRLALSVYGPIEHNPTTHALSESLDRRVRPGASLTKRTEHVLADRDELRALVGAAGFEDVRISTEHITVALPSAAEYVHIQLTATPLARLFTDLAAAERQRMLSEITGDLDAALASYTRSGGLFYPQESHIVLATA